MNNQAPELSPEARRIISEARGADDPTADDRARVKARWLASVAAVAGVSSLTEAARAASGLGWGLKVAGTALVAMAGAIGVYITLPSDTGRDPSHAGDPAGVAQKAAAQKGGSRGHSRFEKTPAGEQHALEGSAERGANRKPAGDVARLSVSPSPAAGSIDMPPSGASSAVLPAAGDPAPVALPSQFPSPGVAPPGPVEAAPPAPSVLEPAEVPAGDGIAQPAVVEAPATGAMAARANKSARRERAVPRAQRGSARAAGTPKAVLVVEPQPIAPSAAGAPAAGSPATNARSGQLGGELALLSEVRSSVQEGAGNRALELLARYRSQFARPILGMEADALKVDALCKAGQREAARASARAFQNDWPGSPLEGRVNAACP